jgi:proteasome lid subunit RPN8/RPN11
VSTRVLHLADDLAAQILLAAARSHPDECCGLIEGVETEAGWRATVIHEAANVADDPARSFLIDPKAQFDLMRRLRGSETRLIGCFHSHPGGEAKPSATDRANAYGVGFLYLIAAGAPDTGFTLACFVSDDAGGFAEIPLP